MVYTAKTFSAQRYELWNCRAMYHNVPMIGGYEQQAGAQYAAGDVQADVLGMTLDLAAAYPGEAGVLQCRRSFRHDITLCVRDEIVCAEEQPVTWVFMLRHAPLIDSNAQCCELFGSDFRIDWSGGAPLTAAVEEIKITDGRMAKSYPGSLWRLTLTAEPSTHHTQEFLFEA
jgi:hypothetical protein